MGQFVAATSDLVFFSGSPQLSETWFPSSERATATAIGAAIAPQVGILIALGVTPVVIHSPLTERVCNTSNTSLTGSPEEVQSWSDEVYYRWLYYQCAVAGVAILTFLLTVCSEWQCGIGGQGAVMQGWLCGAARGGCVGQLGVAVWGRGGCVGQLGAVWGRGGCVGQLGVAVWGS